MINNKEYVYYLLNYIVYFLWLLFLYSTLERRFSKVFTLGTSVFVTVVWIISLSLLPARSALRVFSAPALPIIMAFVMYRGRFLKVFFLSCIPPAVTAINELILVVIFPVSAQTPNSLRTDSSYLAGGVLYLVFEATVLWLISKLLNRQQGQLGNREWLLFAIFPLSQAICLSAIIWASQTGFSPHTLTISLVVVVMFAAADIAMYFAIKNSADRIELRIKNALLAKQLDLQREHYSAITQQYENIRKMRHDIANHIQTIQILLQNGQISDAEAYTGEILPQHRASSKLGQCENPIIDAYLFSKSGEAAAAGITIEQKVLIPAILPIANSDLVCVFGNLLDNAMEACKRSPEKVITLTAGISGGYLLIIEENQAPQSADGKKERRISELDRGLGFHILDEIAQQYNGVFSHEFKDGRFKASIYLEAK